jgi:hypothetical protein
VDKSGQKSVDNPANDFSRLKLEKSGGGGWLAIGGRDPPCRRFGGGDCGGTKHLQKKFFKKSFALVDIKRKNTSQFSLQQLHAKNL